MLGTAWLLGFASQQVLVQRSNGSEFSSGVWFAATAEPASTDNMIQKSLYKKEGDRSQGAEAVPPNPIALLYFTKNFGRKYLKLLNPMKDMYNFLKYFFVGLNKRKISSR